MNRHQAFLLFVIGLSGLLSLFVVLPFLEFVLASIIFAYVLHPVHLRIEPHLGHRLSPIAVILLALVGIFGPLLYVTLVLVRDLQRLARGESGLDTTEIEATILEYTDREVDLDEPFSTLGADLLDLLFGNVAEVVSVGLSLSIGLALLVFLLYYLLRDGRQFVRWSVDIVPVPDPVCERLIGQIDRTTKGVVIGHLFVAVVQGLVGGVGLFVAGIPNVVFWTFVMITLALLPLIGAFLVWAPASLYLLLIDQTGSGLFLFLYGLLVVSMIDNYARPIVIDREAHLNPGIILVGVFGGVYAIGFTGLFIGPIILGVLAATLTIFEEEYDSLGEFEDD
ncbi:MAG: AI-2E family transporter [Natronomonas sp.]